MQAVDLFAGAGGWDVGARKFKWDITGYEIWKIAVATRDANDMKTVVSDLAETSWVPADVLIASPPCQGFSVANAHRHTEASSERRHLIWTPYDWAVSAHRAGQPYKYLAFENVIQVLPLWEMQAELLRSLGYHTWTSNVNCADLGLPQRRRRAFLLASLDGPITPPQQVPHVGFGSALGLKGDWTEVSGYSIPRRIYYSDSPYSTLTGGCLKSKLVQGRLAERPNTTVGQGRPLTIREASMLQSFPEDFRWRGKSTEIALQIGNAVPPMIAEQMFQSLLDSSNGCTLNTGGGTCG